MKNLFILFCMTALILSSCRQEGIPVVRPHSKYDSLEYLVSKADLIAVVTIADSFDSSRRPRGNLPDSVKASINEVLLGNAGPVATITISRFPAIVPPGASPSFMALGNGKHLAFLRRQTDHFAPLTAHSIIGDDHPTPIWMRDKNTDAVSWSVFPTFDEVIADVSGTIEKAQTPNNRKDDTGE